MSKYIDIKTTVWERYYIPDDVEIPKIKSGENIQDFLDDNEFWDWECESLLETSEWMSVEDNGGNATMEMYDENYKIIWDNVEND